MCQVMKFLESVARLRCGLKVCRELQVVAEQDVPFEAVGRDGLVADRAYRPARLTNANMVRTEPCHCKQSPLQCSSRQLVASSTI